MSGWFAVRRGITSHALFKGKPERLAVWMWLLDNAVWKDTTHDVKGHTVDVPRGSVCASERYISEQCGVGYQVVRTAIKRFKSEHMINATPTHGKNLISLCNYEKYQDPTASANAAPNATPTQRQRNANAQKEQGNNITTEEAKASLSLARPNDDIGDAFNAYNEMAERLGLPVAKVLSKTRAAGIKARLKDAGGIDGWRTALAKTEASPHCNGANNRGWLADLDFLLQQKSFTRLMEGSYDDRTSNTQSGPSGHTRRGNGHDSLMAGFAAAANQGRD